MYKMLNFNKKNINTHLILMEQFQLKINPYIVVNLNLNLSVKYFDFSKCYASDIICVLQ